MQIPDIRPTAQQIAELDQKTADLAALGQLMGKFRKALLDAGFADREAFAFVSQLFQSVLIGLVDDGDDE